MSAIQIAAIEAKNAAENGETLEDKLKLAMKAMDNHWIVPNKDDQFRAALAGVMSIVDGEDRDRLNAEILQLKTLNAALGGVPVDLSSMEKLENPIGLIGMWNEIRSES